MNRSCFKKLRYVYKLCSSLIIYRTIECEHIFLTVTVATVLNLLNETVVFSLIFLDLVREMTESANFEWLIKLLLKVHRFRDIRIVQSLTSCS